MFETIQSWIEQNADITIVVIVVLGMVAFMLLFICQAPEGWQGLKRGGCYGFHYGKPDKDDIVD